MKVRLSAYADYNGANITHNLYFEDILQPLGRNKIDTYDLISKTITHIEESDEIEGALILTLE